MTANTPVGRHTTRLELASIGGWAGRFSTSDSDGRCRLGGPVATLEGRSARVESVMRAIIRGWCSVCHGPMEGRSCRTCGRRPELFAVEVSDPPKVIGGRGVYRDLLADLDRARTVTDDICARLGRGSLPQDARVPVRKFCEQEWLPAVETELAESTYRSYHGELARHVWPHLGDTGLRWMSYRKVSRWMDHLDADGRTDGCGGLSPRTVNYVRQILHRALELAVARGYVAHNPCPPASRVRRRGQSRTTGPRTRRPYTWTDGQLKTFLARTAHDRLYVAWRLVAGCGLWRGELLSLRWTDVDLDRATLAVAQEFVTANGHRSFAPVTGHARRTIALDQSLVLLLEQHRGHQGQSVAMPATGGRSTGSSCASPTGDRSTRTTSPRASPSTSNGRGSRRCA